jgi:hypothetical protein
MTFFPTKQVWKAIAEPKCKFFAWLIMHDRAPAVDNLARKNWSCNPTCSLCLCQLKTSMHLLPNATMLRHSGTSLLTFLTCQTMMFLTLQETRSNGSNPCLVQAAKERGEGRLAFFSLSGGSCGKKEIKGSSWTKSSQFPE